MTNANNNGGAAKTRLIVGAILLPILWLLTASCVVALLLVLPDYQVRDYAWAVVLSGMVLAGIGSYAVIDGVMQQR